MLHPVGPLPPSIYWRRRIVAFAGAILVLVLFGWLLGGGSGRPAAGAQGGTGTAGARSSTSTDSTTAGLSGTAADSTATPSGSASGTPAPIGQSGVAGGGAGVGGGDPTAAATTSTGPTTTAPPGPCQDSALRLTVRTAAPAYRVGEMPVIVLTVQNVSAVACTRDLGAAQQEVLLYSGATRLWSSNDCYPGGEQNVQTLAPREHQTSTVTWSGLSSQPRCAGTRTRVGPGSYRLLGRIGTLGSAPATLTLR